jgi:hypothetical protein
MKVIFFLNVSFTERSGLLSCVVYAVVACQIVSCGQKDAKKQSAQGGALNHKR